MSFLGLILLILVLMMLWPVIKIAAKIWLMRRQFNNAYRQAYASQHNEQHRASASGQRTSRSTKPRHRRKRIGADVGEYVEFEEIESSGMQTPHEPVKYKRQEQVSDAEWEEIS